MNNKKRNQEAVLVLKIMIWIILSLGFFIYFHFYRVPIIGMVLLNLIYFIVSIFLIVPTENTKKNKKILLICMIMIMFFTNAQNIVYWMQKDIAQEQYLEEIENKENFLLEHNVVETP